MVRAMFDLVRTHEMRLELAAVLNDLRAEVLP
jgi:hypothetical protein